jgi:hypothetical protein
MSRNSLLGPTHLHAAQPTPISAGESVKILAIQQISTNEDQHNRGNAEQRQVQTCLCRAIGFAIRAHAA